MKYEKVLLSHGDGGVLTRELIADVFMPYLGNKYLDEADDSCRLEAACGSEVLITTDSFVVEPLFFPGGDIGKLSVFGTLNDLWVSGAKPLYLAASFIIEEGLDMEELTAIVRSMALAASQFSVPVVAGDTKVVPRGAADKLFITTTGVGVLPASRRMIRKALPGDRVLVSGSIGEHGLSVLASRLNIQSVLASDCGPVGPDVDALFRAGAEVHMIRDPSRGGLATALNEVAQKSGCDIVIDEARVPVSEQARDLCELLGVDIMYMPCEGRAVAFVGEGPVPDGWTEIGRVLGGSGTVLLKTRYGVHKRLVLFEGAPLPRIC